MACPNMRTIIVSAVVGALALVVAQLLRRSPDSSSPYSILGVARDADSHTVTKAYRALAKRWHPDRNSGDKATEQVFATIAHAYEVLTDPEKREIFDRLGSAGLERLRDGDPSVRKDYLPPDEILRRLHNDGDQAWLDYVVTTGFARVASLTNAVHGLCEPLLFDVAETLGIDSRLPSVRITASESVSGAQVAAGGSARGGVTFKLTLSGKSFDFEAADVSHSACASPKFLGMKTTFYLQCAYAPGAQVTVSVPAHAFTVTGRHGSNVASQLFVLDMI